MTSGHPHVSIVVRAFNEARHLPALVAGIAAQTYRDFELILVDSGSVDGTPDLAEAAGFRVIRIDPEHFTFGYSLNTGIAAARGEIVAIISAHCVPASANWLECLVAEFDESQTAMVYGKQLGAAVSKFSERQDFRRTFGERRKVFRPPNVFANNANSCIRRSLWAEYHFDASLPGLEDIDWAGHWARKGWKVVYAPAAAVFHIHEETRRQVANRYYREAVAARRIGLHGPARIPAQIAREIVSFVSDGARATAMALSRSLGRPLGRCLSEIAQFRWDKASGSIRGLLDAPPAAGATRASINFDTSYEAVVVSSPGHASLQLIPMPEMRPGDAVVEVVFVGICGTDIEILNGTLGYFANGLGQYPVIPGHEVSGRVVATGPAVSTVQPGDRVVIECIQGCGVCPECRRENAIGCAKRRELGVLRAAGGYARYVVVPARFLHTVPDGVSLRRAALCEPLAVVIKGLERLSRSWPPLAAERRVAVVGGGAIGRLSALVLTARGHRVTLYDRDPSRLSDVAALGIESSSSFEALAGFDDLIEATGDAATLDPILIHSRAGANILLLGLPYSRKPFSFESVVAYDKTVIGSVGSSNDHFRQAVALIGRLPVDQFLTCSYPLERFEDAWAAFRRRDALKVMIAVGAAESGEADVEIRGVA